MGLMVPRRDTSPARLLKTHAWFGLLIISKKHYIYILKIFEKLHSFYYHCCYYFLNLNIYLLIHNLYYFPWIYFPNCLLPKSMQNEYISLTGFHTKLLSGKFRQWNQLARKGVIHAFVVVAYIISGIVALIPCEKTQESMPLSAL